MNPFSIIMPIIKANPLKLFKVGIFIATFVAFVGLVWRVDYLSERNSTLSSTVKTQKNTIDVIKAYAENSARISKANADNIIKNERSRAALLLDIERSKDETPVSPIMLNTYQRLRDQIPTDGK